jgi:hypothetical protein
MSRLSSPPALGAALVLALSGAGALGWVWLRDGRITPAGMVCALLPFALLAWGVTTGDASRSQIAIKAWAFTMFGALIPAIYAMQSGPDNWLAQWRFMAVFGVAYFAILIAFMLWLAPWTARVVPAPGTLPVGEARLQQRLRSLIGAGLDVRVEPDQPGRLFVTRDFRDGKRALEVRLTFVEARHCVLAREVSLVRGDKPMNVSEAQMYSGPRRHDGVHPDADRIYDASLTITPPDEAIRRRIGLRIAGDRVEIAGDREAASAPQNLPHVLTELVNQSGWTWQGVFGNWQRGCR